MRPDPAARTEYVEAFKEIVRRISRSLTGVQRGSLPVRMYVAGGAAMHLMTGERVSEDIDAVFVQADGGIVFSTSSSVSEATGDAPRLALTLVFDARPMAIGSSSPLLVVRGGRAKYPR